MASALRSVLAVASKDLRIEFRSRTAMVASLGFAAVGLVIINFSRDAAVLGGRDIAPTALWLTLAFAGTTALQRSFAVEDENDAGSFLRLVPAPAEAVFLGKWLANLVLLAVVAAVTLPLTAMFFNVGFGPALPGTALIIVLALPGYAAVGTIMGALSARTRFAALLLPLLLLPFLLPPLVGGVEVTTRLLTGRPLSDVSGWLRLLAVYDVVFVTLSALLYPALMSD